LSPYHIYPQVGVSSYFGKEFSKQAACFEKERLERILLKLSHFDWALKTGHTSPWGVLEQSLFEF